MSGTPGLIALRLSREQWAQVRKMMLDGEQYVDERSGRQNPELQVMADTIVAFDAALAEHRCVQPVAEPGAFQRYTGHEPLYAEHGLVGRKPQD